MKGVKSQLSRRHLLKASIGLLGSAALAACAPYGTPEVVKETAVAEKEAETVVVEAEPAEGPVEIRLACYQMGESWMENAEAALDDFMSKNPGIKVKMEWRPGQQYWDKLQTEFAAGTAPDVSVNQMNWVIPGAARGMFLDLKPFIERDNFDMSQYFYPMDLEWEWRGGLYGGLLYAGGQTLMINKDLLAEAGLDFPDPDWTWDDLLQYAQAMTDKEKGQYGLMNANANPPYWLCSFIHGNGGSVLNDAYNKCTINEPEAVEAVQWVYDLMYKHEVMPTPASIEGQENPFLTGRVGMAFNGTWFESQVRDAGLFEWDFAHMPKHPSTGIRSVQLGSNSWSILANTQHREEAWQLVKFLMGVDGQRWFMKYGIPGIKSVIESQEYLDLHAPQDIRVVADDFACCGHDYYPTADCGEWWNIMSQEMSVIWSGEVPVEEALNNACVGVDEVFSRRPAAYEKFPTEE